MIKPLEEKQGSNTEARQEKHRRCDSCKSFVNYKNKKTLDLKMEFVEDMPVYLCPICREIWKRYYLREGIQEGSAE